MKDDSYEIIPHQLLADLRDEVDQLKKKLAEPDNASERLMADISSLREAIHELHELFFRTLQEMKEDDPLIKRLDQLVSQNETIASGMVAITQKVDDFIDAQQSRPIQQVQQQAPPPSSFMPEPMPKMPPFSPEQDLPPPPPGMTSSRKKSLGDLFS